MSLQELASALHAALKDGVQSQAQSEQIMLRAEGTAGKLSVCSHQSPQVTHTKREREID